MSGFGFPKSVRILRRSDFRKVYDEGSRFSCPYFAAFCLQRPPAEDGTAIAGPKVGFTTTKALGKAVARNRMKRRLREAVRANLAMLPPGWSIVLNARKAALEGEFAAIEHEIQRLFAKCANS